MTDRVDAKAVLERAVFVGEHTGHKRCRWCQCFVGDVPDHDVDCPVPAPSQTLTDLEAAEKWLREKAKHTMHCGWKDGMYNAELGCTCGLAALAGKE